MKLLAIDAGNTRVKWARHDGAAWSRVAFVDTAVVRGSGQLAVLAHGPVDRIIASNVAGAKVAEVIESTATALGLPLEILASTSHAAGVTNGYENPAQLGTDRWAALAGAHTVGPRGAEKIVVLAGTAVTVDALSPAGQHRGGIIFPGLGLMRDALAGGTARLKKDADSAAQQEPADFPRDTATAIATGVNDAFIGAFERFRERTRMAAGSAPVVLGAGGTIGALAWRLPFPITINENLVFDGLLALSRDTSPR